MADEAKIMALAKVLIAVAWADQEIAQEEVNSLKDLLFRLPDLSARQWEELQVYLDKPVDAEERQRLVDELLSTLITPADRNLVLRALDDLVGADHVTTNAEREALGAVQQALGSLAPPVLQRLGGLLGGAIGRRSEAVAAAPNREEHLEDYVKNRVFFRLRDRSDVAADELDLEEQELRKVALAGALLARVAHIDADVSDEEINAMAEAVEQGWSLPHAEALVVAEVAASEAARGLDYFRASREFFDITDAGERVAFLDSLFAVARSHDQVSNEEIEEIRTIAGSLKLSHKQFINAKLKIPREERGGL
ncbi:MAG: TerB family tellurite resistance protein [Anaerolineae bacterium]